MIFTSLISTPANTSIETPLITTLKIVKGLIYQFSLYFPPGSSGLSGLSIYDGTVQLYPFNRGSWFIGDNTEINFPDLQMIENENQILRILTYNLDTDYEHTLNLYIGMVDREDFMSSFVPSLQFNKLNSTMENVNNSLIELKTPTKINNFSLFGKKEESIGINEK